MSASVSLPEEVSRYLQEVRAALADLPADEREELLADVEGSLLDAAGEAGEALELRLGPPAQFAGELRAAAGLAAPASVTAPPPRRSLVDRLRDLANDPRLRSTARELAPLWWVARAYVAVAALTLLVESTWYERLHLIPALGPAPLMVLLIVAAMAASVALGLRGRRGPRRLWGTLLNLALLAAAVPVAVHIATWRSDPQVVVSTVVSEPAPGLVYNGAPVTNLYPFSRDGKLLLDVLLYDQDGQPIAIESPPEQDPFRRRLTTERGDEVPNAFPLRYFEPGTSTVRNPKAGPPINPPEIATPPLRSEERRRR